MKKIMLLFFILIYSCNANKTYINKAIDIMEENSIKKDSVDWKRMRTGSLIQIKKNNTRENVYQTLGLAQVLTTSIFADRTKEKYGGKIKHDVYSSDPKRSAIEWLK